MSPKPDATDGLYRARVPADIDTPDQIAWGLTFRQLAILAAAGTGGWLLYSLLGPLLPPVVWLLAAVPLAGGAVVVALGRRDGLPLDVWLRHGLTYRRTPRLQVPGRPRTGPPLLTTATTPAVTAPLNPAATTITADGTVTIDGTARHLIACGTTNVGLRTGTEQATLLAGFARWLNALTRPAQIVVTAQRHDLTPHAHAVLDQATRLPHPALRDAAADYAAFLLDLDQQRDPLRRQVTAVVTGTTGRDAAVRALAACGVAAAPLDGPGVVAALATAVDPYDTPPPGPRATPDTPITARSHS